jgi:outer membrane receptor protein involved in Fe transport
MKSIVLGVVLLLSLSGSLFGQAAGFGAISGAVHDPTGARVPGAEVVISSEARGVVRTVITNEAGIFTAPALVPGAGYTVTVKLAGFQDYTAQNINLQVGQEVSLDVELAVAGTTTSVSIVAEAPVVDVAKTEVSQVVTTAQIQELPINGRRVDTFVLLTPAVVPDGTFGLVSFRGVAGGNSFLTDGNDTTNQFYNENAGRSRISSQISQDAVQEFQVLTNGYAAEFGRASGGVINTVTRSGGNTVHGTGYWFFRNQNFSAKDRYATSKGTETRQQFGGSVGGPIQPDKFFYFLNAEFTRRDFPLIARLINPQFFDNSGNFLQTCTATATQCAAARAYLNRHFQTIERTANSELGFAKLDYVVNSRNTISANLNALRWLSPNGIQTQAVLTGGQGLGDNANATVRTRYGRVSWTSIPTNTMANEFRFGWFKDRLFDSVNPALVPKETGELAMTIAGQSNLGTGENYPRLNPSENRFQFADSLTWTRGPHTLKFGFDVSTTEDYNDQLRNRNGSYTYSTWNNFALDFSENPTGAKRWQTFSQRIGNPILDFRTTDYSAFAQDQYRFSDKLTLSYGLRYDFTNLPDPKLSNPNYPQTAKIHEYGKNFAPRLGFAYSMDDKTVFRGGYGIFYARYPGAMLQSFFFGNGSYQSVVTLNGTVASDLALGPVFPNKLALNATNLPGGTVDVIYAAEDLRTPYTQQADLAIERQLTSDMSLTVNYIWSRGIQMLVSRDTNIGPEGPTVTYRINDSSGNQVGTFTTPTYLRANRVDTRYNRVIRIENAGRTYYDALAAQLKKRMSKGIEASVAYTWSHAIDTANQGGGNNTLFFDSIRSTYNGQYEKDKGSSSLDQRHRLVVTTIFQPTFTTSQSAVARYLINNWQFTQITTAASAQATTPTVRIVGTPFTGAAQTGSLNGLGGSNRVPFLPFSSLDIDQVFRTDARLSKLLPIGENVRAYVNFEAFNVFNHVSNTGVFTEMYSATNGVLTPSAGVGNGNQSQGFPDGTNARRAQLSFRVVF